MADAGSDSDEVVGFEVTADGAGSSSGVSYSWTISSQPENSSASLSDVNTVNPKFIPDLPGEYILQLEVTSGGETETDEVTFSAIAKRIFVDANNGADGSIDGYLPETPLKTISQALSRISQNENDTFLDIDTMRVAKGVYDEANGENFPLDFYGPLIVKGDQNVDRDDIHILSPDVDRDAATRIGEGVTLRHMHIENGYTGGTYSGDPDAVFVFSGSDMNTSTVLLEDVTITMNAEEGKGISTGNNMTVELRGYDGARNLFNGNDIGLAYTNRFNTDNITINISDTDFENTGDGGVFDVDDIDNLTINVINTTFKPGNGNINASAFELKDEVDLTLDDVTITSSSGMEGGERFKYGIVMNNAQPNTNIEVKNSTIQFTQWSAIWMRESVVKVTESVIEGVYTHQSNVNTYYDAIKQSDGTLTVRGTIFRDMNTSAIEVGGPSSDLGTNQDDGNNVFQNVRGFDVEVLSGADVSAFGNTWSNGATPRCVTDYENGEVFVNDQGGSLRYSDTGVCN
jgi:hypothetical protein